MEFSMKRKGSCWVPIYSEPVFHPSGILDGRNQLFAHYRSPNAWMPRKQFELAGSCIHVSGVPYKAMRILSSDGQIIPFAHKLQEQAFSSFFVGKEKLMESGFICKDKRLTGGIRSGSSRCNYWSPVVVSMAGLTYMPYGSLKTSLESLNM